MTDNDIAALASAAAEAAAGPVKRPLMVLSAVIALMGGGGGTWAYHTDGQISAVADHELQQDEQIARNGRTIRQISVLLVQQGRHFEGMVRAAAEGKPIPGRPPGLNAIEAEILTAAPLR